MRSLEVAEPVPRVILAAEEGSLLERLEMAPTASLPACGGMISGHLEGVDDEGRLLFRPERSARGPFPVVIGMAAGDGELVRAARNHARALAAMTADPFPRWVLVGILRERVAGNARDAGPGDLEVRVDGEKFSIQAEKEIELRCGRASLKLRRDGHVVLSGTYVVSTSSGPNKIKGATIALN